MSGGRTPASLRRLRLVLWAGLAAISAAAIVVFAVVLVRVDTANRRDRLDVELRGRADRGAALMFVESGRPRTSAVSDDALAQVRLLVFGPGRDGPDSLLYRSRPAAGVPAGALRSLAAASRRDGAEQGRRTTLDTSGGELRAVAMPWFDGHRVRGSVVALGVVPTAADGGLLAPAIGGGAALWLVLLATGWFVLGRGIRPAVAAMAEREAFLATAAHELRTPLARLRAGAETVERSAGATDERRVALSGLVSMADSATHVVNNLLLAAGIDWGSPPVQLHPERIDQLLATLEHADPAVIVDVSEAVTLDVDVHLLRHALTNLVDNALRHARTASPDPLVLVTLATTADAVRITVEDNGPGFPPDLLARTWRAPARFETATPGGTGLGLSLVAWITAAHRGRMTVENAAPSGARVTLALSRGPAVG